jgi:hypothetical protein
MLPHCQPRTEFDWKLYSNATFAGLSALIPIPLIDLLFEEFFRRRLPQSIARTRGRRLDPLVERLLIQSEDACLSTCLTLPLRLIWELVKSLSRKLLYVLSIKEATDKVSYYWHQAFLIDYMIQCGHLDDTATAFKARAAMKRVLRGAGTSPLLQLASQITLTMRHSLRSLFRARRGQEDELVQQQKTRMFQHWANFAPYLRGLAAEYDQVFAFVDKYVEEQNKAG